MPNASSVSLVHPRVLFLTVMPSPYQRELFQALHSDGRMQIRVLYFTNTAPDRNWTERPLSPYEELLPGKTFRWLGPSAHWNSGIFGLLKKYPSDLFVLSDYSAPTTQIAMRELTRRKKKWVFWGESPGFHQRGWLGSALRSQLQRPIAGATAVAAIGSGAVDVYQRLFPGIRIFNIPYFCDLARFRTYATGRWTRHKETVDVLFSGQFIERKGVDLLIQAFARISDQVPELHLQLLGTGPLLGDLMNIIPSKLRERIRFLGFHQTAAIPKLFAAADVFVLPSRHDGWGVVVNEALGAGLPIIVSDRVGARDLVENGVNGFITIAGNVDSLASALLKLARSGALRESFGRASANRAVRWDVDEGVRRWVELSDQALKV
jgi:glycosyltransferase involved in cell wall biosynthesis